MGSAPETVLAIDIGGTKANVGLVSHDGRILFSETVPTPPGPDPELLWAAIGGLIDRLPAPPSICGVGCGGPMTAGGEEVSPLNIPAWKSFPLRERLTDRTGLPVWVDNDAKALALAEGWIGSATGHSCYLSMVVSTGIGGGLVLDDRLIDGDTGNAGHIGHVIVEPGGRLCACGSRGCLEAEASGTAIAAITGSPPERASAEAICRAGRLVGRGVASVVSLLDIHLTTVSGSVGLGFGELFFVAANQELAKTSRISFTAGARIMPSGLGRRGPLLGAAAVGLRGRGALPRAF